nr:RecName: Full=Antifungal peptide; AltName: Full=Cm-p1 [Cenchritis muricatus]
SRSELIVHQR